eukprot:TRINITY_DN3779_c0_g1_i1.p1 TRINITY_DN3779_c0_g1~~TRINITY_DN3779_c0_g1_i1.p1  ORF type:complete len:147 (-),score=31.05 TRINITY_DN3779_c0_g1_i1:30-470(-)
MLGYGQVHIRPSAFCGFMTCLVNTEKYTSMPVTRFLNLKKFYSDIQPHLDGLINSSSVGFFQAMQIRKIFKNCAWEGVQLPDLLGYLTEKSKAEVTRRTIRNAQFLVVHNNMDISTIDLRRRCNCMSVSKSSMTKNGFSAACTGCI